ncbi:MAG: hypothetical protein ABI024_14755 [Vicinamibacterales bacterium]
MDSVDQTVTVMDVVTGKAIQTAKVEGAPTRLLRTPDGRRILVLDRGQGDDFGNDGFRAKTKSALTILDGRTLAVQGRVELGTGLDDRLMLSSAGDRLAIVCPGYRSKKPAEVQPRELITIDLANAQVLSRIELTRPSPDFLAAPDGNTIVVLSPPEKPKNAAPLPAELRLIDPAAGKVIATIALEGDPRGPVLAPDAQIVYLLDRGKPNDNPDKNQNGKLHAVSLTTREVIEVSDAGSKPRGLVLDEDRKRLLLLSDGPPVKGPANKNRAGELRIVVNGKPGAPIAVGSEPERIEPSADGKFLNVLGMQGVTRLALPGLQPSPVVEAPGMGGDETAISADGRRGWASYGEYFTTYDLEKGARVAQVKTGRLGKKMFLALETGLKTETSRLEGETKAKKDGRSYYSYTEYTLKEPKGSMAVRPDGKEIYALNTQTSDVTVIDADTGQVIEKVAAGGFAIRFMPSASAALVVSSSTVAVIDFASHQKLTDLVSGSQAGFNGAKLSPDARFAVLHGPQGLMFVSVANGKPIGTMVPGRGIADVDIDWREQR